MSKAVLISIRPEWCAKIASGEKTIEVRKTRPKLPTPLKCYIYCTVPRKHFKVGSSLTLSSDVLWRSANGKLKCGDGIELIYDDGCTKDRFFNGKVIGEFVCDEIYDWHCGYDSRYDTNCLVAMTCLDAGELYAYGQGKPLYGWNISELKIYDTPKELREFYRPCVPTCEYRNACGGAIKCLFPIRRAPQSWCYVEELT